jgi:D-aminopeptidase
MTRLRDLGFGAGATGPHNAITDVAGVQVGHVDIRTADLATGLTAVVPYPTDIAERKLFIGRFAIDGGAAMTGLGVAEDFGTFSSPIVLAPAPAVGQVYEGLIAYGLARDPGLTTEAGWPPVIVGVDDADYNDAAVTYAAVAQVHVAAALENAGAGPIAMGNAGIGGGLQAFGYKGGLGTAARRTDYGTVGVLVAVNGGAPGDLRLDGRVLPAGSGAGAAQNFAMAVATDAPLIPRQLARLAERAALGLARVGLWSPATREGSTVAFSTTGIVQEERTGPTAEVRLLDEDGLYPLFAAAAAAAEEAVFDGLLAAEAAAGLEPLAPDAVRQLIEVR